MDLQYLLFLQQMRYSAGEFLTTLMLLVSNIASVGSVIICIAIYWGVDRRLGYWVTSNCVSGFFFNNVIKLTACVYRPWIRNPELTPPAKALESATGYSFPSGHTQIAASFYGSLASAATRDKTAGVKGKVFTAFCIFMIILTGFSRLFLSVHTPQDVLIAILSSVIIVSICNFIFRKAVNDRAIFNKVVVVGCVIVVIGILYFALKSYPINYIDGALVVDPEEMKEDGFTAAGAALGLLIGAYFEVHYVRFATDGTIAERILRVLCGVPLILLLLLVVKKPVYALIGTAAGHVLIYAVLSLYVTVLYPALFTAVKKHRQDRSGQDAA